MRIYFSCLFILICSYITGQVNPIIEPIANTIYLSPSGNDANNGTINQPLLTFNAALNDLPYGSNGNTIYSEIVFLEGNYIINTELRQACWQFDNGNGYKAVSIRGEGNVVLDGSNAATTSGNFIELLGSHISVKNITLKLTNPTNTAPFWAAIDFKSAVNPCSSLTTSNVLIENVTINGCWDHGIHIDDMDTVLIKDCSVKNTNLINTNGVTESDPNTSWGSGIKTRLSSNIEIVNCEIRECWGEGISTARTTNVLVHQNKVYDNYSVNIYIDNVINGVYKNNLTYATIGDDTYWRTQSPSSGFGVAAEYYPSNDYALNSNVKIYNNIILNTSGVYFDDNRTATEPKIAEFNDIWFCNNSIVGWQGDINENIRAIRFDFADHDNGLLTFNNMYLYNNLIARDQSFLAPTGNGQMISGYATLPDDLSYGNNFWSLDPNRFSFYNYPFNTSTDEIDDQIPLNCLPSDLSDIIPLSSNNLIYSGQSFSFILDDYFGNPRNGDYNIGAILPNTVLSFEDLNMDEVLIYPNPVSDQLTIENNTVIGEIELYTVQGKRIFQTYVNTNKDYINLDKIDNGVYFLKIDNKVKKIIVQ